MLLRARKIYYTLFLFFGIRARIHGAAGVGIVYDEHDVGLVHHVFVALVHAVFAVRVGNIRHLGARGENFVVAEAIRRGESVALPYLRHGRLQFDIRIDVL